LHTLHKYFEFIFLFNVILNLDESLMDNKLTTVTTMYVHIYKYYYIFCFVDTKDLTILETCTQSAYVTEDPTTNI
jgi:hypothetical protein